MNDQRMQRISNTLQKAGYEVTLVGRQKVLSPPLQKLDITQKRLKCFFKSGVLFYAEYNIRLLIFLLYSRSDIICAVDADTLFACTLASIIKQNKLVFDAHEYYTEVPELENRFIVKSVWAFLLSVCVPYSKLSYTVNRTLAEIFSDMYGYTFHVIGNLPISKEITHAEKKNRFIYIGDLNEGRGLEVMINAIKIVDAELWIVGDGPIKSKLIKLVDSNHLANKVIFTGRKDATTMHALVSESIAGLNVLYPNSLSYYYSSANKFFDYIQAGVPVINSRFPEYERLQGDFEVAVWCEYDALEMATAMKRLMTDDNYYLKLVHNCKAAAKAWNWENEEQNLLTLYGNLLNG